MPALVFIDHHGSTIIMVTITMLTSHFPEKLRARLIQKSLNG